MAEYKKNFKDEISDLINIISEKHIQQEPVQFIKDIDVVTALIVLNLVDYITIADIFLGCASLNLLNAYVKQEHSKLNYQFKRHITNLVKGISDIKLPSIIKLGYDNSSGQAILIISILDFQFSFKSIRYSKEVDKLIINNEIHWDGIRKQPYARTIFETSLYSPSISNRTLGHTNLREKLVHELTLFQTGSYKFENGKLLKVDNFTVYNDELDFDLKNYYRVKLEECKERPVIVSGIFVHKWDKHITFRKIRPYIEGVKAALICDHINIYRKDLETVMNIDELIEGNRYYLIGYCEKYWGNRIGLKLAIDQNFLPIFGINEFRYMQKDVLSVCYRFSIEEYIQVIQGHLKL